MQQDFKIDYLELPGDRFEELEAFYTSTFGWKFTDFGSEYRAFSDGTINGGFYKSTNKSSSDNGGALIVLYASDLEAIRKSVIGNGGVICKEIFSFPGGRRFHFQDPHGNELAVWSNK